MPKNVVQKDKTASARLEPDVEYRARSSITMSITQTYFTDSSIPEAANEVHRGSSSSHHPIQREF
jgi:hypothetical protein